MTRKQAFELLTKFGEVLNKIACWEDYNRGIRLSNYDEPGSAYAAQQALKETPFDRGANPTLAEGSKSPRKKPRNPDNRKRRNRKRKDR